MSQGKVFVVGGTGAQGMPVIRGLVKDQKYTVRALTRDTTSRRAQELLALGNVELVTGTFASEVDLRAGYEGCEYAFINIDGFNTGEKTEIFWAIRAYELALECGIKFFVYGNLDYGYKLSGYDPKFRCGHYDGKGRVADWILRSNKDTGRSMGVAIFTTGPYMEMTVAKGTPMQPVLEMTDDNDGNNKILTWRVPLGTAGAVPHVALDDCEHYVRWLFDHRQTEANGLDLRVAIEHVDYHALARAFHDVTGHPARFVDVSMADYWEKYSALAPGRDKITGYNASDKTHDLAASMTVQQNFTGFWNLWRASGGNTGVIKRDYDLLDRIHPNRIRTVKEWFERENAKGNGDLVERVTNLKATLKIHEDGGRGRL